MLTPSFQGRVVLWDTGSARPLYALKAHKGIAWGVAFSPDGRLLASGSGDRTVRLWDTVTGREIATLPGHTKNMAQTQH